MRKTRHRSLWDEFSRELVAVDLQEPIEPPVGPLGRGALASCEIGLDVRPHFFGEIGSVPALEHFADSQILHLLDGGAFIRDDHRLPALRSLHRGSRLRLVATSTRSGFVALADTLSFTRAAERVHVTQSTLSHQIRQLEDEIGRPLFDRIGKRVLLTDAGETFLGYAAKALREVDQGLGELKRSAGALSGEVRIGATHTFNIGFVPECLAAFMARHPTVKISVEELAAEAIGQRLAEGTLDVGIAYEPADPALLWFEPRASLFAG